MRISPPARRPRRPQDLRQLAPEWLLSSHHSGDDGVEGVERGVAFHLRAEAEAAVADLEPGHIGGEARVRSRPGAIRSLHACGVE